MKQRWIALRDRTDALSLRERMMIFAAAAGMLIFLIHTLVLTPLFARRTALQAQISQQRNHIGGIDAEIVATVHTYALDPDAANNARLLAIKAETRVTTDKLRAMQSSLVTPEQMAPLLESILRSHGRLQLIGLATLPVGSVSDPIGAPAKPAVLDAAAKTAVPAAEAPNTALLYRHGVELTVRGNYLDMINYMAALEAMPAQLIWGKADLAVETYPNARLAITVYTLSLDKKWMKL